MSRLFNYNAFTAGKNNLLQNVIQIFSYIQNAESINFNNLFRKTENSAQFRPNNKIFINYWPKCIQAKQATLGSPPL